METEVAKQPNPDNLCLRMLELRRMSEDDFIEKHASGTLRKSKRIGMVYRSLYLKERTAYEFGYNFEILPRSLVTFGDPITEGDCHPLTEAGWHIERYLFLNGGKDEYYECKYIHVDYPDGSKKQGLGIIVRRTTAQYVPTGHIVFAIVTEFDPIKGDWKEAVIP